MIVIIISALFFFGVYTESLFLLTIAAAVYYIRIQNYSHAAFWGILLTATKLIGVVIIPFALWEYFSRRREQDRKIELNITHHTFENEFTLSRNEVNILLKEALSERELDVFMLLIEGCTNKMIGEKLFVSINTIKFHLQNIYVKLDVDNRNDAIETISKSSVKNTEIA